jgi:hypothetical protein
MGVNTYPPEKTGRRIRAPRSKSFLVLFFKKEQKERTSF